MYYKTAYATRAGQTHDAIQIPWDKVSEILGHKHDGSPDDDDSLVVWLRANGAPAWVDDAEGWGDEDGWGLIGPENAPG